MSDNENQNIFRKKTLERISSPEQLNDYLRVTNPSIWIVLVAVILLLIGVFAWATIGTLETTEDAKVIVRNHTAQVVASGTTEVNEGMILRVSSKEAVIASATTDEYGRTVGMAEIELPDGNYDGTLVVDQTKPISFLMESR